ncbi:MAG: molybdopterin cofactor-binding domain-containing protein, partial [Devosia sp.]
MNKHEAPISLASLHTSTRHDSGPKHVTGTAEYIDDMIEPAGTMHAYLALSTRAHAEIVAIDYAAVRSAPGVIGVLTAEDIPGENDVSPSHKHDEPIFAIGKVHFWGQPLFAVIAETRDLARRAAHLAKVEYRDLPYATDIRAAQAAGGQLVTEPLKLERGDIEAGLAGAPRRAKGSFEIGGQDHFYLEGQISMAVPGEDEDVTIFASTQHPSEVQLMVAAVLGIRQHAVTINVRRMGGGFGGKETQGNLFAAVAALAAKKWNRTCKIRPDRDDDMTATGKRHDFVVDYDVGYDDTGKIHAVDAVYAARAGFSSDLSGPVTDRALFHADNAYWYPAVRVRSEPLYTNTVSNTAFRGFGGPQGMLAAERWIEDIAYALGKDPLEIRKANFYGTHTDNVTPYHQTVEDNIVHRVVDELEASSDYQARRAAIIKYNAGSPILKKGIALTPVKFGISFTA